MSRKSKTPTIERVNKSKTLQVRLPPDVYDNLTAKAKHAGVTVSEYIRRELSHKFGQYLDEE